MNLLSFKMKGAAMLLALLLAGCGGGGSGDDGDPGNTNTGNANSGGNTGNSGGNTGNNGGSGGNGSGDGNDSSNGGGAEDGGGDGDSSGGGSDDGSSNGGGSNDSGSSDNDSGSTDNSGGGSDGSTNNSGGGSGSGSPTIVSSSYLFYEKNNGDVFYEGESGDVFYENNNGDDIDIIYAVDPTNPAVAIKVAEAEFGYEDFWLIPILAGNYDASVGTIRNANNYAYVYGNKVDTRFYKIDASKGNGLQAPVQLSSEMAICGRYEGYAFPDFANPDNTRFIYSSCSSGSEVTKMVRLGMSATDAPLAAKYPIDSLSDPATGALIGWLVNDAGELKRCDINFLDCGTSLKSISESAWLHRPLWRMLSANLRLLIIDNSLYSYDVKANKLALLYQPSADNHAFYGAVSDGKDLYFLSGSMESWKGKTIYIVPLDGSEPAKVLFTSGIDIYSIVPTSDKSRLIYSASGGLIVGLGESGEMVKGDIEFVSGKHIYYQRWESNAPIAGMIDEDGSNQSEVQNAEWQVDWRAGRNVGIGDGGQTIIRVEGYEMLGKGKGYAGGALRAFNAATGVEIGVLGTIPNDVSQYASVSCDQGGVNTLCWIDGELYFVNTETPNSLTPINTPATTNQP